MYTINWQDAPTDFLSAQYENPHTIFVIHKAVWYICSKVLHNASFLCMCIRTDYMIIEIDLYKGHDNQLLQILI